LEKDSTPVRLRGRRRPTGGPHPSAKGKREAAAAGSAGLGCASAGPLVRWASPAVVERGEKQASAPSTIGPPGKEGKLFYFFSSFFSLFVCFQTISNQIFLNQIKIK
jgi:hypothetical protein